MNIPCVFRYGNTVSFLARRCSSVKLRLKDRLAAGSAYNRFLEKGMPSRNVSEKRGKINKHSPLDMRFRSSYRLGFLQVQLVNIGHVPYNVPDVDHDQVACR